ncbi:DUF4102 domain-containing protein [Deferribacteraceae bacterium V6Fe1]|nr:DUF4102 domain-containing protein [Deferribacteraceae bacterium V6Fe1]
MAKKNMSEKEIKKLKPVEGNILKERVSYRLYIYVYENGRKVWYYRQNNNSDSF